MNFYTQKRICPYFGLQKVIYSQLFKEAFKVGTKTQHRAARAFGDDTKTRGDHAHISGNGRPKITEKKKYEVRTIFSEDPALLLRSTALEI